MAYPKQIIVGTTVSVPHRAECQEEPVCPIAVKTRVVVVVVQLLPSRMTILPTIKVTGPAQSV